MQNTLLIGKTALVCGADGVRYSAATELSITGEKIVLVGRSAE